MPCLCLSYPLKSGCLVNQDNYCFAKGVWINETYAQQTAEEERGTQMLPLWMCTCPIRIYWYMYSYMCTCMYVTVSGYGGRGAEWNAVQDL